MAATEEGLVFTGARARFSLNGIKIGWATNVSGSEEIEYFPVEVTDNIEVQEHVPIAYRVTLTASRVMIIGKTLKSQGFFPPTGANADQHLQNILTSGNLVASVEDSGAGVLFAQYQKVKVANHNWTVQARGIVGNDVSFVAIRLKDQSEV